MSIHIFITAIGAFAAGWLLHLLWWRVSRPVDDLKALAACLLLLPVLGVGGIFISGGMDPAGFFLSSLLSVCLGMAYIFWYPAAQAASPTMLMTIIAAEAGDKGFTEEELHERLTEDLLSGNSLESLVGERFASEDASGRISLAPRGRRTLHLIRLLRHCAGFEDPKG